MLFDPYNLSGKLKLRNRIALAPLYLVWDGRSVEFSSFYVRRARGGVGLVIAPQSSPGGLDDWEHGQFGRGFRTLVEGCHRAGARIALQVFPGIGPPDAVSAAQLDSLPERFARAASGAIAAGFDAVEIHGAHHSLFMRLLSPLQNRRRDRYGGSREGSWRVQLQTVRKIRAEVGEGFPVIFRFSAADFVAGGVDLSLSIPYAQALEEAGVDALHISAGTSDSPPDTSHPDKRMPLGCFSDLAASIKASVKVPVIAVGKIATRALAESILREEKADLVALGRPLIVDPDWPKKVMEGRESEVIPCLWDNKGCLKNSIYKGKPIRCIQNPEVGFEHQQTG
ncbi:MAG TPA: NADH:flavin oxidoreductase [Spirochaetia bacterium]|nr:NADH:flavin oxidoreductase [Spirochaetia bacterium]